MCTLRRSFTAQGRLGREYLRFLWLHHKPESNQGVEVTLNERDFDSMVRMMVRLLVIYQSPADVQHVVFIVPARLPEYGDEKVLEKSIGIGEDIVKTTLTFEQSYHPPVIIGRFLAYNANKIKTGTECWQHGAHIVWEDKVDGWHDILIFEGFVEEQRTRCEAVLPSVEICVKGNSKENRRVLEEVKDSLRSMINDRLLGYPGLGSLSFGRVVEVKSSPFKDLCRYLDNHPERLQEIMERIHVSVDLLRGVFPIKRERTEYPRLVLLKPEEVDSEDVAGDLAQNHLCGEEHPRPGALFQRKTWDRWARAWQSKSCRYRLVFICEHSLAEVPCGLDGKGYLIKRGALSQAWIPLLQVRYV